MNRLDIIRQKRAELAENYFQENASHWGKIRALHVPEADVEAKLLQLVGPTRIGTHLDIGTGTGRMLELFAAQTERGIGLDLNSEMLAIARTQLGGDEYRHVHIRKGDMYNMPIERCDRRFGYLTSGATLQLRTYSGHRRSSAYVEKGRTPDCCRLCRAW